VGINPRCNCGFTSRIGKQNRAEKQWFHCPVGRCAFNQDVPDGHRASWRDGAAEPPRYSGQNTDSGPRYGMGMNGYEGHTVQDEEEKRESCCGCLVM
jgi:hypothetical protein